MFTPSTLHHPPSPVSNPNQRLRSKKQVDFINWAPKPQKTLGLISRNQAAKKKTHTPWKFNSSPLKINHPKRKGSSSNHHFSGAKLNFGGVTIQKNAWEQKKSTKCDLKILMKVKLMMMSNFKISSRHPPCPPSPPIPQNNRWYSKAPKVCHGLVCYQPRNSHRENVLDICCWEALQLQKRFWDDSPKLQVKFFTCRGTIVFEFCWIWWWDFCKKHMWSKLILWVFQELVKSQGGLPKTCLNTSELLPCMKHEVLPCGTATLSGGFNPFEKVYAQSKVKNLSPKKSSLNTYVHI